MLIPFYETYLRGVDHPYISIFPKSLGSIAIIYISDLSTWRGDVIK